MQTVRGKNTRSRRQCHLRSQKNVAAVGFKAGPILSPQCVKTAISFSRRHCSDVDTNVEITLLDVFGPF